MELLRNVEEITASQVIFNKHLTNTHLDLTLHQGIWLVPRISKGRNIDEYSLIRTVLFEVNMASLLPPPKRFLVSSQILPSTSNGQVYTEPDVEALVSSLEPVPIMIHASAQESISRDSHLDPLVER